MNSHQFLYVIFVNFCFSTTIKITLGDGNEVKSLDNNNEDTRRSENNPLADFYAKSVTIDLKIDDFDERIQKVLNEQINSRRSAIDAALRREELDSGEKNIFYRRKNDNPIDNLKVEGTDKAINQDQLDATEPRGGIDSQELQSGEKQRITNEVSRRCLLAGSLMLKHHLKKKINFIARPFKKFWQKPWTSWKPFWHPFYFPKPRHPIPRPPPKPKPKPEPTLPPTTEPPTTEPPTTEPPTTEPPTTKPPTTEPPTTEPPTTEPPTTEPPTTEPPPTEPPTTEPPTTEPPTTEPPTTEPPTTEPPTTEPPTTEPPTTEPPTTEPPTTEPPTTEPPTTEPPTTEPPTTEPPTTEPPTTEPPTTKPPTTPPPETKPPPPPTRKTTSRKTRRPRPTRNRWYERKNKIFNPNGKYLKRTTPYLGYHSNKTKKRFTPFFTVFAKYMTNNPFSITDSPEVEYVANKKPYSMGHSTIWERDENVFVNTKKPHKSGNLIDRNSNKTGYLITRHPHKGGDLVTKNPNKVKHLTTLKSHYGDSLTKKSYKDDYLFIKKSRGKDHSYTEKPFDNGNLITKKSYGKGNSFTKESFDDVNLVTKKSHGKEHSFSKKLFEDGHLVTKKLPGKNNSSVKEPFNYGNVVIKKSHKNDHLSTKKIYENGPLVTKKLQEKVYSLTKKPHVAGNLVTEKSSKKPHSLTKEPYEARHSNTKQSYSRGHSFTNKLYTNKSLVTKNLPNKTYSPTKALYENGLLITKGPTKINNSVTKIFNKTEYVIKEKITKDYSEGGYRVTNKHRITKHMLTNKTHSKPQIGRSSIESQKRVTKLSTLSSSRIRSHEVKRKTILNPIKMTKHTFNVSKSSQHKILKNVTRSHVGNNNAKKFSKYLTTIGKKTTRKVDHMKIKQLHTTKHYNSKNLNDHSRSTKSVISEKLTPLPGSLQTHKSSTKKPMNKFKVSKLPKIVSTTSKLITHSKTKQKHTTKPNKNLELMKNHTKFLKTSTITPKTAKIDDTHSKTKQKHTTKPNKNLELMNNHTKFLKISTVTPKTAKIGETHKKVGQTSTTKLLKHTVSKKSTTKILKTNKRSTPYKQPKKNGNSKKKTQQKTTIKAKKTRIKSKKTTVKPKKTTIKPNKTTMKPKNTTAKPKKTTTKPKKTITKPKKTTVKPKKTTIKPKKTTIKPKTTIIKPKTTIIKPTKTTTKPKKTTMKPKKSTIKPKKTTMKPKKTTIKPKSTKKPQKKLPLTTKKRLTTTKPMTVLSKWRPREPRIGGRSQPKVPFKAADIQPKHAYNGILKPYDKSWETLTKPKNPKTQITFVNLIKNFNPKNNSSFPIILTIKQKHKPRKCCNNNCPTTCNKSCCKTTNSNCKKSHSKCCNRPCYKNFHRQLENIEEVGTSKFQLQTQQGDSDDVGVRLLDTGEDQSDVVGRIDLEPDMETTVEPIALRHGMHRGKKGKKSFRDKFLIECLTQKKNCDKHQNDDQSPETESNDDDHIIKRKNPFASHGDAPAEDRNLTKLAYVISKHIVNSLPKDMRNSNWAADLAFKIVYEKLKMYDSGNFGLPPFGLPFQQNYMYGNSGNNGSNDCCGCCCDGEYETSDTSYKRQMDSQINVKVGNENTYKCLPTIDKPPSEGYALLEDVGWFKFHDEHKPWNEARKQCFKEGAHLAFMESPQETQWCIDHLLKGSGEEVFLGIHNYFKGDWVSVSDTEVETMKHLKWSKKEPDGYRFYNCAIINPKSKLVSRESCTVDHPFICKVPL
ncbi:hypothetical protein G9C98_004161 [Cotesia typhae]|uniref:C-type lectin domain-containing protein n=1 Tax=Cotesia typhae TaxID=2053667 RepID=A0A8J5R3M8_9HYME|nr:hypothetical protein G9C98_004161 [Cotesia typhae]